MKKLLFSLIIFSTIGASIVFGQTPNATQEEILNFIQNPQNTTTKTEAVAPSQELQNFLNNVKETSNLNEEDQSILNFKTSESASDYIKRIETENAIRKTLGKPLLPDPTISTTQIPEEKRETQLGKQPPIPTNTKTATKLSSGSTDSLLDQIVPKSFFGGQPLNKLLNQLFYVGLVIAVILALVMIIRGGVEYMTIDAISSKESGKNRVKAALGGLLLAFSAIMILNTINPSLTKLSIVFPKIKDFKAVDVGGVLTSGTRPTTGSTPTGSYGSWNEGSAEGWVNGLENGVRSTDGRLVVSTYSATGDSVTDSNTSAKRGNASNLLREGSVALSPDLIAQYRPKTGQEVFVNGISVGFYEDATASQYNGVQFRNTIDIYDENKTIGSKLKNVPTGAWNISFGEARPQISNP